MVPIDLAISESYTTLCLAGRPDRSSARGGRARVRIHVSRCMYIIIYCMEFVLEREPGT